MAQSASIVLAMLPFGVFGMLAIAPPPAPPIAPVPVQVEGVTARRMDDTFARRFAFVPEGGGVVAQHSHQPVEKVPAVAAAAATAKPRPARIVRRAALRTDICAKHGLRKVTYLKRGYQHWRCRR